MNWQVTQVIQMTDKISVRLEHPAGHHPVRMTWDGKYRTYHYDGTSMLVEPKYHRQLLRALRNYFILHNK
jgi:2-methylcitrate dehydratase PrpD